MVRPSASSSTPSPTPTTRTRSSSSSRRTRSAASTTSTSRAYRAHRTSPPATSTSPRSPPSSRPTSRARAASGLELLGPILDKFVSISPLEEPIEGGKEDNIFINALLRRTSHFDETVVEDVTRLEADDQRTEARAQEARRLRGRPGAGLSPPLAVIDTSPVPPFLLALQQPAVVSSFYVY